MRLELARLRKLAENGAYAFALYVRTPGGSDVLIDGPCGRTEADTMLKIAS